MAAGSRPWGLSSSLSAMVAATVLAVVLPARADATVQRTLHDFTVMPPAHRTGAAAAAPSKPQARIGVCAFCHTLHNAKPTAGLWNRSLPAVTYKIYESPTLQARPTQPTGSSRLCLSCHDGTLALGDLRVRPRGYRAALGPLQGSVVLGTDLSDDHPISFVYDVTLAARKGDLVDPSSLPQQVRLDGKGEMQCTSCHDAHEDRTGKFLVLDNRGSRLCVACHHLKNWADSSHATSLATETHPGNTPWPHTSFINVADNGCENCHRQHAAGHPEWLLLNRDVGEGCFTCHDGSVAAKDVRRSFRAVSAHPVESTQYLHQPNEDPLFMKRHVACSDCHDPHSVRAAPEAPAATQPARNPLRTMPVYGSVDGVDASGVRVRQARAEFEVCYKCHGLQEEATFLLAPTFLLTRSDNVTNVRLQFNTNNMSFHPVESVGRNASIRGFEAGYTPSTVLSCTDCHNSDQGDAPGAEGARGPHGSAYEPILIREYQVDDPSPESYQSYALCYRCHNQAALFSSTSNFPHRAHVQGSQISCAVCHDAHGSRHSLFLVNFLQFGKTGNPVVEPLNGQLTVAFNPKVSDSTPTMGERGRCTLRCHNHACDHLATPYPGPIGLQACSSTAPAPAPAGTILPNSLRRPKEPRGNALPSGGGQIR